MYTFRVILGAALGLFFFSSQALALVFKPVDFVVERYMGEWYEIARLDSPFQAGHSHVKVLYTFDKEGGIRIDSESIVNGKRIKGVGSLKFKGPRSKGEFEVSYFKDVYDSYIIFELEKEYNYAFIASNDKKHLWLLSRSKDVKQSLKDKFVTHTKLLGFKLDTLVWTDQSDKK